MADHGSFARMRCVFRYVLMVSGIVLAAGGCELFTGPRRVGSVGITLGFPGHVSDAALVLGVVDTIRAQAYSDGLWSRVMHDSEDSPRRFTYFSSDTAVASVDPDGVIRAKAVGTTFLTASTAGKTSLPMTLNVVPPN